MIGFRHFTNLVEGRFLRWNATRPRKVLFVDGTLPAPVLQQRLKAIISGLPAGGGDKECAIFLGSKRHVRSESGIYITGGLERAERVSPALKRNLNCFDDARPEGARSPA